MERGRLQIDKFGSFRVSTSEATSLFLEKTQPFDEFPGKLVVVCGIRGWPRPHYEVNSGKFGQDGYASTFPETPPHLVTLHGISPVPRHDDRQSRMKAIVGIPSNVQTPVSSSTTGAEDLVDVRSALQPPRAG